MVATEILWQVKTEKPFNIVANGKIFRETENSILTGGEDGVVRVYEMPDGKTSNIKCVRLLETKCGAIFHLRLHDVIRLVSQDLVTADSRGSVTVFCHGQIFMRTMPEKLAGIKALQIHESGLGHLYIVTGTEDGIVNCFNAFTSLWKVRLRDIVLEKSDSPRTNLAVTSVLATAISSTGCPAMDYVVVADSEKNLHFIQEGKVLLTISTPAVVKAMASGHFLHFDEASESDERLTQIALGCDDGSVWVCVDFEVQTNSRYADVGHPISHLYRLPPPKITHHVSNGSKNGSSKTAGQAPSTSDDKLDLLLCTGHFPSVFVLREGKALTKHPLPDWAVSVCEFKQGGETDERNAVLVGCQNSTMQAFRVV